MSDKDINSKLIRNINISKNDYYNQKYGNNNSTESSSYTPSGIKTSTNLNKENRIMFRTDSSEINNEISKIHNIRINGNSSSEIVSNNGVDVLKTKLTISKPTFSTDSYVNRIMSIPNKERSTDGLDYNISNGSTIRFNRDIDNFKSDKVKDVRTLSERDIRNKHAERFGTVVTSAYNEMSETIKNTIFTNISSGDYEGLTYASKTKQDIEKSFRSIGAIKDVKRVVSSLGVSIHHGMTHVNNVGRYIKGNELKQIKEFKPYTNRQYKRTIKTFNSLEKYKSRSINREIRSIKKIKKGGLSLEQQSRLKFLTNYKQIKRQGEYIKNGVSARNDLLHSLRSTFDSACSDSNNAGIEGVLKATDIATNKYVRNLTKATTKVSYNTTKYGLVTTKKAVKYISDKTGVTNIANNQFSKLLHTRPAITINNTANAIRKGVNGGIYNSSKTKVLKYTPSGIKTSVEKGKNGMALTKSVLNKAKNSKLSKGVKKGLSYVKTPFKAVKKVGETIKVMSLAVKKIIMFLVLGILGIAMFLILINTLIGAIASIFPTGSDNVQKYVEYVEDLQKEFEQKLDKAIIDKESENDSLHTHKRNWLNKDSLDNTKEILTMAAVYIGQDWPNWYEPFDNNALKKHIKQLFNDSHSYEITYSPTYYCSGCKEREVPYTCSGCKEKEVPYICPGCIMDEYGKLYCEGHIDIELYCEGHIGIEKYCDGHKDVIANINVLGFNEIFGADSIGQVPKFDKGWNGWDLDNIQWVYNLYEQDWAELYGVNIGTTDYNTELSNDELKELIGSLPQDLSQSRLNVMKSAAEAIGKIPYYWNWRDYYSIQVGLASNNFGTTIFADDYGRTSKGLDSAGFIIYSFMTAGISPETAGWGAKATITDIFNSNRTYQIEKSELKVGDLGLIMSASEASSHIGIYAGDGKWIRCSPYGGVVVSNYSFKTFLRMDYLD